MARRTPSGITLAHDYLTQRGGAERVFAELVDVLDPDLIETTFHDPAVVGRFDGRPLHTSGLNRVGVLRRDPRRALPLLAPLWSARAPVGGDLLVCSSSGWAHGLRAAAGTRKIVYCYNPARWLYQTASYLEGMPSAFRLAFRIIRPALVSWDRRAARSADEYIAISTVVAERITAAYGIRPTVIAPPMTLRVDGEQQAPAGIEPGYFLTVARARAYKGTSTLVEAFAGLPDQRLVVVGGTREPADPSRGVIHLGHVTEEELRWLYANARALISVSQEDFGLTPVEANAFGTPALLLRAGGFLDTLDEGVSGRFIDSATVADIRRAVTDFPATWDADAVRRNAQRFSRAEFARALGAVLGRTLAPGDGSATHDR